MRKMQIQAVAVSREVHRKRANFLTRELENLRKSRAKWTLLGTINPVVTVKVAPRISKYITALGIKVAAITGNSSSGRSMILPGTQSLPSDIRKSCSMQRRTGWIISGTSTIMFKATKIWDMCVYQ